VESSELIKYDHFGAKMSLVAQEKENLVPELQTISVTPIQLQILSIVFYQNHGVRVFFTPC